MCARECQLDAAAQADPMDRRDGRNRQRLDLPEDLLPEPDFLLGFRRILEFGDLIHVGAGDERIRLAAADHDYLDLAFSTSRTGAVERFCEEPHDRLSKNVQLTFRIVERDPSDTARVDLERW